MFEAQNEQADARVRATVEPQVVAGESLLGCLNATAKSTFSAQVYAIGVTDQRLIFVPLDRKFGPKGPAEIVGPADIVKSSVDGQGGGLSHFLATDWGEIRIDTATKKYKLLAMGGGADQLFVSENQRAGKQALLQFLYTARVEPGRSI